MNTSHSPHWLPLAGVIACIVLGWIGLMFRLAGNDAGRQRLTSGLAVLRMPAAEAAKLTPAAVAALPEESWQPWAKPGFLPEQKPALAWVRVTLANPGALATTGVLADRHWYTDWLDAYVRENEAPGGWRHERSGEWTPSREKAFWGREVAVPVTLPAHGNRTVYLRYEDRLALWLDLAWWPDERAFHAAVLRGVVAECLYFGTLLALLLYNAVLWARVRFPSTGTYLLYLGTFLFYTSFPRNVPALLGLAMGSPVLEILSTVMMALSGLCLAEFSRRFLELPERLPRADRVVRGAKLTMAVLAAGAAGAGALGWNGGFAYIALACAGLHVVVFGVAFAAWRAGTGQARFFVLALGFLLAGLLPVLAVWLPGMPLEALGRTVMTGAALEMLVLSLGIADRFAGLQQEKIAAQAQAMVEAERREQMQEAYADDLEHEVGERTHELATANADKDQMIAVLGHDLRSPLIALTLAAEQATKQPAARENLPVEAAQVGRQLLFLIEDVVLWARLQAGGGKTKPQAAAAIVIPAVELHRAMAVQRGVVLELEAEPGLQVLADFVPVQALVRNLVSNAVKFAHQRVQVQVEEANEAVRISVCDDGPGLPPRTAALLRGAETVQPGVLDSGLGLRLCMKIAQSIGTQLEVGTPPEGGTEMAFTLPRAAT